MKILPYTFRTFQEKAKLDDIFGEIFVFGKLKEDFDRFSKQIKEEEPDYVLGIALANKETRVESIALNRFSGGKTIIKGGSESMALFIPSGISFQISRKGSDSFCNWTMYKLTTFIKECNLPTKLIFIHIAKEDFGFLRELKDIL